LSKIGEKMWFIGVIVGVLVVKSFWLDPIELMGWEFFWEAVFKGNLSGGDMEMILKSTTLYKSLLGFFLGAYIGERIGKGIALARKEMK
jgi:hypothetical protein